MNIFALHNNPRLAARFLCNFHVVKMLSEAAEMLLLAHWHHRDPKLKFPMSGIPLRLKHLNHPCTVWARSSASNYMWLQQHADELCREYWKRYGQWKGSQHDYQWEIQGWLANPPDSIKFAGREFLTPFAIALGDFRNTEVYSTFAAPPYGSTVVLYRAYYLWKQNNVLTPMVWPDTPPPWFATETVRLYRDDYFWADMLELYQEEA